jgi:hypothetical protein
MAPNGSVNALKLQIAADLAFMKTTDSGLSVQTVIFIIKEYMATLFNRRKEI